MAYGTKGPGMTGYDVLDDFRQAFIVMKNEITKYARGKKLIIFAALTALILAVVTAALTIWGDGLGDNSNNLSYLYIMIMSLLVLVAITLFASTALVSEFEERTALILFTKPIRKWSIFLGKFLASLIVTVGFVLIYYAVVIILCLIGPGYVDGAIFVSLGLSVCYTFGCAGIGFLISSVMKKSSTSSILTFFTLALLLNMVLSVIMIAAHIEDPWFVLTYAANDILYVLDPMQTAHAARAAAVMIVWGVSSALVSYFLFRKRDF